MDILSPIQYIKGVGPRRAALLAKLGIEIVKDILFYLPSRYEDRSSIKKITQLTIRRDSDRNRKGNQSRSNACKPAKAPSQNSVRRHNRR